MSILSVDLAVYAVCARAKLKERKSTGSALLDSAKHANAQMDACIPLLVLARLSLHLLSRHCHCHCR
jgi:hypothetical protein